MYDVITIDGFIRDTKSDIKSTKDSNYASKVVGQKAFVNDLYDTFDEDRTALNKLRKSVKAIHSSGMVHIQQEMALAQQLGSLSDRFVHADRKNDSPLVDEQNIGTSISKFSIFYREQAKLQETLMQNMRNTVLHPLDSFLKGTIKGDIKKPVDKAFKEFDNKYEKMRKEICHQAKECGQDVSPGDLEKSVERERRLLQLNIVKYLIQISEMQSKEGAELVQYLIAFYQAQKTYFNESVKVLEHLGMFLTDVESQVREIKARQDDQRRTLVQVKEELNRLVVDKEPTNVGLGADSAYSLHQPNMVGAAGTFRSGYLLKKSEGKVKRLWQRRHVTVTDGSLFLSHADETKPPVKLNLLTCHIKPQLPDGDARSFDLLSNNRTYHFQAETEGDREIWVTVINNAKRAVFDLLMHTDSSGQAERTASGSDCVNGSSNHRVAALAVADQQLRELRNEVLGAVRRLPGNESCADCGAPQPEWVSVNLGVLICLECCGLHRELGVHHSRTQSLVMDDLKTTQLLLPRFIGNQMFNEVFESVLPDKVKPSYLNDRGGNDVDSRMDHRKSFIRAKYVSKNYVCGTSATPASLRNDLRNALIDSNMPALLQCFGEGVDLLAQYEDLDGETALHVAVREGEDSTHLHMVQFLLENSSCANLTRTTRTGDTVLHYCAIYDRPQCLKLVLRALQTDPAMSSKLYTVPNNTGQLALDLSAETECERILKAVYEEKRWELCEQVDTDWDLSWCEHGASFVDYLSEEDLDDSSSGMLSSPPPTGPPPAIAPKPVITPGSVSSGAVPTPVRRGSTGRPQSLVNAQNTSESLGQLRNGVDSPKRVAPGRPPGPARFEVSMSASVPIGCTLPRRSRVSTTSSSSLAQQSNLSGSTSSVARRQSLKGPAPPPPKPQVAHVAPTVVAPPASKQTSQSPAPKPAPKPKNRPVPKPRRLSDFSNTSSTSSSSSKTLDIREHRNSSALDSVASSWFGDTELFSSPLSTPHRAETLGRPKKKKRDAKSDASSSLGSSKAMSHSTDHINVLLDVLQEEDTSGLSGSEDDEPIGKICTALYSCSADAPGDLNFSEGEIIRVTKVENDQWWYGVIDDDPKREGMFPVTYVHIVK